MIMLTDLNSVWLTRLGPDLEFRELSRSEKDSRWT